MTVSRPYIAHASMSPSCALAEFRDGHLTVRSHGQGMHPLRKNLAPVLGLPVEAITAQHLHGAGCYGHNGADDAALDAALVAMRIPSRWIRLQWRREEEFGFEPVGPAMLVTLHVDLDERGRPADWTTEIWSPTHVQRPGSGSGYLLASEALANPPTEIAPFDPPEERGGGGTRNAVPLYDVPAHRILHHLVMRPPVRTSALRGLGALPNVFAIESLIDDLAARAGEDPVAYRLSILSEPRARRLVELVAERAGWTSRGPSGTGKGLGLAFARYKNRAAYAAVVAAVTVQETVKVDRVWCVADAGLVVNPDGARNQLEGGIVQAVSWTLKEQVQARRRGHRLARLGELSDPALQRGARDAGRVRRRRRKSHPGRRRMHGRPDRRRHRKCRESCAWRAHSRHAAHPRAHHGGVAENLTRPCYPAAVGREEWESLMRLLALLFALLSMPVLAAAASWPDAEPAGGEVLLAQQTQQKLGSGPVGSSGRRREPAQTPRHPGDYCTSHCRAQRNPVRPRVHVAPSGGAKCTGEDHHHLRGQALKLKLYAAACTAVGPSPASVVRRMSRGSLAGKGRARCMVWRLSHITRSPTRHLWV